MTVRIEWDKTKRLANIRKHGIDFRDCKDVFSGWTVTTEDLKSEYGEIRFITLGLLKEHVVVIAHTESDDEHIRIISARKAIKQERELFFQSIGNRLESDRFHGRRKR